MKYTCPRNQSCNKLRCGHHFLNVFNHDTPVHEPCEWYFLYLDRQVRKDKLNKLKKLNGSNPS